MRVAVFDTHRYDQEALEATSHQGFLTRDALTKIAATELTSITFIERQKPLPVERVISAHVTKDVER